MELKKEYLDKLKEEYKEDKINHRHSRERTLPSAVCRYPRVNFDCRPSLRTNLNQTKTNRFLM